MKFEYLVMELYIQYAHDRMKSFNELGAKGWELVAINQDKAYFQRPLPLKPVITHITGKLTESELEEAENYLMGKDEEESE